MNVSKQVFSRLFKEERIELEAHRIELAMDFSDITKKVQKGLNDSNKQVSTMSKASKQLIAARNPDFTSQPSALLKQINSFYKDYSKKAADLGIDVKGTNFYKDYIKALDLYAEYEKNAKEYKDIIKSIK